MCSQVLGYFKIRKSDNIGLEIKKNKLISQTYIYNFKKNQGGKIIINLPWQFKLSKKVDIVLDDNLENSLFEERLKNEVARPEYLYINGYKMINNGILELTWAELLNV